MMTLVLHSQVFTFKFKIWNLKKNDTVGIRKFEENIVRRNVILELFLMNIIIPNITVLGNGRSDINISKNVINYYLHPSIASMFLVRVINITTC